MPDFGLIIITRKRVKQSLERVMTEPCPYCAGTGVIKSTSTMFSGMIPRRKPNAREKRASGRCMVTLLYGDKHLSLEQIFSEISANRKIERG